MNNYTDYNKTSQEHQSHQGHHGPRVSVEGHQNCQQQ